MGIQSSWIFYYIKWPNIFVIAMDCFQLERLMRETGICQREKVLEGWELAIR